MRFLLYFLMAGCLISLPATAAKAHILDLNKGDYISFEDMMTDLASVRIIFIGELHDSDAHHRAQLQVIHQLKEMGVDVAVGLEMFQASDQWALDLWSEGELAVDQFLPIYNQNWSMWPVYSSIFRYARDNEIPMIGLNLDREVTRMIASNGFASLPPSVAEGLPPIRCDISGEYQEYLRKALGGHGDNGQMFMHFCEAQVAWDTFMAWNLNNYLQANPGKVIVTLAGSGHSWRFGIPEQIERSSKLSHRILLPEMPGRMELGRASSKDGDYLLLGTEAGPMH
ncbi:MAG: iron-regulated protein [Desulfuromonas sp.]|nr:MAG: iron-regulated protein [Desulfuromonas sp.]